MTDFPNLTGADEFGRLDLTVVGLDGLGLHPAAILAGDASGPGTDTTVIRELHGASTGSIAGVFNGTDYARVTAGTVAHNVHGMLVTEAGEKLSVKILGETADGTTHAEIRLRHYGDLAHLNDLTLLAVGSATAAGESLTVYSVDATAPFADPDVSTVDYANFPFTLESLEADDDAWSVYSGQGRLNGAETFGTDVISVFAGQVPFPDEGIRMNGYFAGPAAGGVNGVISGRNFLHVTADGASHMNSKIIVRTFDGERLLVEAKGASFAATGAAWWETSRTVCNLPRYADMVSRFNVGVGSTDVATGEIEYHHFALADDPFPG